MYIDSSPLGLQQYRLKLLENLPRSKCRLKNFQICLRTRRMGVDDSCIRKEKVADSKISGYVWTGPQSADGRDFLGRFLLPRNFAKITHVWLTGFASCLTQAVYTISCIVFRHVKPVKYTCVNYLKFTRRWKSTFTFIDISKDLRGVLKFVLTSQ